MNTPTQKFQVGDLIRIIEDIPYSGMGGGDVGIITDAFCHEVCVKGGPMGRTPEEGGPEYAMEWGYVATFGKRSQGYRVSGFMPVEVIT